MCASRYDAFWCSVFSVVHFSMMNYYCKFFHWPFYTGTTTDTHASDWGRSAVLVVAKTTSPTYAIDAAHRSIVLTAQTLWRKALNINTIATYICACDAPKYTVGPVSTAINRLDASNWLKVQCNNGRSMMYKCVYSMQTCKHRIAS